MSEALASETGASLPLAQPVDPFDEGTAAAWRPAAEEAPHPQSDDQLLPAKGAFAATSPVSPDTVGRTTGPPQQSVSAETLARSNLISLPANRMHSGEPARG